MSTAVLDHPMMQQHQHLPAPPEPLFEPKEPAALTDYVDANSPSYSPASFASSTSAAPSSSSSSSPPAAAAPPVASAESAVVIDLTAEADDVGEDEKEEWRQRKRRKKMIFVEETEEDDEEDDDDDEDEEDEDDDEEEDEDGEGDESEERAVDQKDDAISNVARQQLPLPLYERADEQLSRSSDEVERLLRDLEEIQDTMQRKEAGNATHSSNSNDDDRNSLSTLRRSPHILFSPPANAPFHTAPDSSAMAESAAAMDSSSSAASVSASAPSSYSSTSASSSASHAAPSTSAPSSAVLDRLFATAHPHQMQCLLNMGYHKSQAAAALRLADGDVYAALRWLPPAVPLSPFTVPSSSSSAAATSSASAAPVAASSISPSAPVFSSLSAAQLNRLRSASSHSAVSVPAASAPSVPSLASSPTTGVRFGLSSPPPPPPQHPAAAALSHVPHTHAVLCYVCADNVYASRNSQRTTHHRHASPHPSASPPASPFAANQLSHFPHQPPPNSMSSSSAHYPPGAIPIAAPQPRPARLSVSRRGRFAAPPASPSPSSHAHSSAFFPYLASEMDDVAGESELRQHLMDTLMSYGMAAAHPSAPASSAQPPPSQHRRSRHSHVPQHYPYMIPPSSSAASAPFTASVVPLDSSDPTGLIAASDTSTLPKEMPAALTSLLTYVHTLAPSLASTQHARLQSITYHLQSLVSASSTAAGPLPAVTKGETPGDISEADGMCPVCWDAACDALLLPCRHVSCCERCAGDMKVRQLQCPRCNERIRHVLVVRR